MTQPQSTDASPRETISGDIERAGLFLVKPTSKSHSIPAAEPSIARKSRSMGLLALAGAALAAPLLWFLHEILVTLKAK